MKDLGGDAWKLYDSVETEKDVISKTKNMSVKWNKICKMHRRIVLYRSSFVNYSVKLLRSHGFHVPIINRMMKITVLKSAMLLIIDLFLEIELINKFLVR